MDVIYEAPKEGFTMSVINPSNVSKNDLIVGLVQRELKAGSMLANFITDVSSFAQKGMKAIEFPKLSSFTVGERAFGVAGNESVITETVDTLALNKNAYISYVIDTKSALQSSIEWEMEAAKRSGSAHGRFVDLKVKEMLLSVATPVGLAGDISKAAVIKARLMLKKAHADMNNVALVVAPDQEAALLNIDEFTRADMFAAPVLQTGMIGKLFGIPCYTHNGLEDGEWFMIEKSGACIGFQAAPSYDEQKAIEYGTGSVKRAVDQLFGVGGLQLVGGVSPLIIKAGV